MRYVYLAGPITGLSWEAATTWRRIVQANLMSYDDIKVLSPLRGKCLLEDRKSIESYEPGFICQPKTIVARDLGDIRRSDVVLFNFIHADKPSIGSLIELGYAKALHKTIIVMDKNKHTHPFIEESSSFPILISGNNVYEKAATLIASVLGYANEVEW